MSPTSPTLPSAPTSPSSKPSSPRSVASRSKSPGLISHEGPKDYAFLLSPQNFLPLPAPLNPTTSSTEPNMSNLSKLLQQGAFHSAALVAMHMLTSLPSNTTDHDTIFQLWFIRLSCLVILGQTKIAATESKALGDLTSSFYYDVTPSGRRNSSPSRRDHIGKHLAPWPMRVLAVRLQALGFGEWRRGIMAYYALAEEARVECTKAESKDRPKTERRMWAARLAELGVLVGSACVEMGDGEAAGRHLASLADANALIYPDAMREIGLMEALVWLKIGDIARAKGVLQKRFGATQATDTVGEDETNDTYFAERVLRALITTCEGDMDAATQEWEQLSEDYPDDGMVGQNLAVCLLYTGRLAKSKASFERLVGNLKDAPAFQPLLFNLATIYELSTDKAQSFKMKLADRVAAQPQKGLLQERSSADYKLV
jgi:trafficking protein particle complex subunit 12